MDVIQPIKHTNHSIALTTYGWNFPGFEVHRSVKRQIEKEEESVRKTTINNNKLTPILAGATVALSLASVFVSMKECSKSSEKVSPTQHYNR